jgi:hypothetical protein
VLQNSNGSCRLKSTAFSHAVSLLTFPKIKQTIPILCFVKKDEYGKTEEYEYNEE